MLMSLKKYNFIGGFLLLYFKFAIFRNAETNLAKKEFVNLASIASPKQRVRQDETTVLNICRDSLISELSREKKRKTKWKMKK